MRNIQQQPFLQPYHSVNTKLSVSHDPSALRGDCPTEQDELKMGLKRFSAAAHCPGTEALPVHADRVDRPSQSMAPR